MVLESRESRYPCAMRTDIRIHSVIQDLVYHYKSCTLIYLRYAISLLINSLSKNAIFHEMKRQEQLKDLVQIARTTKKLRALFSSNDPKISSKMPTGKECRNPFFCCKPRFCPAPKSSHHQ